MGNGLFIGKVANSAGISVQAVRYYERLALVPVAQRTESGYRIYSHETIDRLHFIRQAQALGFRLDEIKEILRLRFAGQSPCECVRGMLEKKLEQVERQMAELAKFRRSLQETLKRSRNIPRLPHSASALCPIIQIQASGKKKTKGVQKP